MQKYYSDRYLLETQALRNGFGKMVNANNQTNPKYSFGKEKRFFSIIKSDNLPYEHKELENSKYGNINIGYHSRVRNKNRGNLNFTSTYNNFDGYNQMPKLKDINFISSGNNATDYYYVPPPPHYYKYSKSPGWKFGTSKRSLYGEKGKYEHYNLPYDKKLDDRKINKKQNMKKYFILLVLALTLGITSQAASQKHRHNPAITAPASASSSTASSTSVGSSTPTTQPDEGIEAYSDTTSAVIDSLADSGTYVTIDDAFPFDDSDFAFAEKMIDRFGGFFAFLIILLVFLFLAAPFIILALVLWLIFRNRNRRYKLAEKAMETGQPLPQELIRTEQQSDEYLWKKGIKNTALGIGLVAFFYCLGADPLVGIGWLVALFGVGQAVIAKTSASKRDKQSDDFKYFDEK